WLIDRWGSLVYEDHRVEQDHGRVVCEEGSQEVSEVAVPLVDLAGADLASLVDQVIVDRGQEHAASALPATEVGLLLDEERHVRGLACVGHGSSGVDGLLEHGSGLVRALLHSN